MYFSKSKYCSFWQCPKIVWLDKYKPEEKEVDESALGRMKSGNEVGDLAMGLFGDYTEVTAYSADGKLNLDEMKRKTTECIACGEENICEASFDYNGLYCAVDILHKENGGYAIYEVKSATNIKYNYLVDVAYQKYVLEKCGVKVTGTYVVCINNEYVRRGEIDVKNLFKITDVKDLIADEYEVVERNLTSAENLLSCDKEPNIDIGEQCSLSHECAYWKYCSKHLPEHNVFEIYRCNKKWQLYKDGIVSFEDLQKHASLNFLQSRQVDFALNDRGTYVDNRLIDEFLNTLSYPLYFLDFETMQEIIPPFDGAKPYEQIPFQYSLHYIESENSCLSHKEFLGVSGEDPRRAIAESLCENIPENVCVLAYNKKFECGRLKELAEEFPDLSKHLLNIKRNVKDLLDPFQRGAYYNKAMGGSFSIKSVLPAIFPDDPALDYHNLEEIHNGGEAMTIFPLIKDMPPEEQKIARKNLLKYCELDTFAMVKVWQELVRVANITDGSDITAAPDDLIKNASEELIKQNIEAYKELAK